MRMDGRGIPTVLFAGVALLVGVAIVACGADAAVPTEASTPGVDAGPAKELPRDAAASEASAPPTPATSCLGPSLPITIAGGLPYVKARVGAAPASAEGEFLLDLATTRTTIDLAAFHGVVPAASGCNPALLGQRCTFDAFDLFGDLGQVTLTTADHEGYGAGKVRPAGILGTDLLSRMVLTLDYAALRVHRADEATRCDDEGFAAEGFVALSSAGFYASDVTTLKPLREVVSDAASGITVPNVPSVPIRVGNATAPAQLDTGFDDYLHPFSINVNEAFFAAITKASPKALVRAPDRDLSLSTCAGVAEPVEAYVLAAGGEASLVDESGAPAFSTAEATVFVKRTPPVARRCGGIGTWTAPAAQIGGTFFDALGATVFDPFAGRVWIKKPGG